MSRAGPPSAALAAAAAIVSLALGALLGLAAGRSSGITVGDVAVQIELDRGAFRGGGDAPEAPGTARVGRPRSRPHPYLGTHLLGRRHVLPAGGRRHSPAVAQPLRLAGCAARYRA